ncbi:hypothetical protein HMPREF1548_05802 [Clostridium sp. KLE 1755]|nr:hypothetical protein HMPREF1548_05802 [Clostridium sp. KLE 1755]
MSAQPPFFYHYISPKHKKCLHKAPASRRHFLIQASLFSKTDIFIIRHFYNQIFS